MTPSKISEEKLDFLTGSKRGWSSFTTMLRNETIGAPLVSKKKKEASLKLSRDWKQRRNCFFPRLLKKSKKLTTRSQT